MTLNDYQAQAALFAFYNQSTSPMYPTLGLCGEAGEVAEKVKKVIRDKGGVFTREDEYAICLELGDVLFYIATLARDMGYSLSDVAEFNIMKLTSRRDRGTLHGSGDDR